MDNNEFQKFANQDFCSLSEWLFSLDAYQFSLVATLMGFVISPTLTINQQNSLGNFFQLLGQVILTINAQAVTVKQKKAQQPSITNKLEEETLEEEILKLKQEVIQLRNDSLNNEKS